jgi:hypothetical protein
MLIAICCGEITVMLLTTAVRSFMPKVKSLFGWFALVLFVGGCGSEPEFPTKRAADNESHVVYRKPQFPMTIAFNPEPIHHRYQIDVDWNETLQPGSYKLVIERRRGGRSEVTLPDTAKHFQFFGQPGDAFVVELYKTDKKDSVSWNAVELPESTP